MPAVVDAHHHLLAPARVEYHFLKLVPQLRRDWLASDLEPELWANGVEGTVCVQAHDAAEETELMLELAAGVPWVAGIVGWVPLLDPSATEKALDRLQARKPRVCGVRHLIQLERDPDWVVQEPVLASLRLLAQAGLAFDLSAFEPRHLEHVATLAERVPELDVVICHLGVPRVGQGEWEPWASAFAGAARSPRCTVKLSGLDMTARRCDASLFQRYVDHALEHFGPRRTMWASNWPVCTLAGSYTEVMRAHLEPLRGRTDAERAEILGGTAARVYRLTP